MKFDRRTFLAGTLPAAVTAALPKRRAMAFTFLFIFQVMLHLVAFLLKANRLLLSSLLTGRVDRGYALKRHPLWLKGTQD